MSRADNESAPKLYIEFEDDESAGMVGEAELVSEREAVGNAAADWMPRWRPGWSWGVLPKRYRKAVAGAAALVGLAVAIGDSLAAQAAQHAAERAAVSVMDAEYSPSADGNGVDLLIDVADTGGKTVTVTEARVEQSELSLSYLGAPVDLAAHQQIELGLWGEYDCSPPVPAGPGVGSGAGVGAAGRGQPAAGTEGGKVQLTVRNTQGNVNTFDLALPKAAQLPAPWRDGRAAYCSVAWGLTSG
jgi:hypothetical protein